MTAAPAARGQEALEVRAGRKQQPLTIGSSQAAQQQPLQSVPRLRFGKAWLDPHRSFEHRLLVGCDRRRARCPLTDDAQGEGRLKVPVDVVGGDKALA